MKTYQITLQRVISETATVEVTAEDFEALQPSLDALRSDSSLLWTEDVVISTDITEILSQSGLV